MTRFSNWRIGLVTLALIASPAVRLSAQSPLDSARGRLTVSRVGDVLHVRAQGFGFIKGEAMDRLKDGRPVRFDFELTVLAKPDGPVVIQIRQSFNLSYDLWEERFAVTRIGDASRPPSPGFGTGSISHLMPAAAEAWCLEQLTVPVSALRRLDRDEPFWLRLQYRVQDRDRAPNPEDGATFTLRTLIDMLSQRRKADELGDSVEAGPFRLPD